MKHKCASRWLGGFGATTALAAALVLATPEAAQADRGKMFMLRVSPALLALGAAGSSVSDGNASLYGAEAEVAVTGGIAIGPILYRYSYENTVDNYKLSGMTYGVRGTWYMNQGAIGSSWILSPFLNFIPISGTASRTDPGTGLTGEITGSGTMTQLGFTFGYQFVADMGFSFSIGAGLQKYFAPGSVDLTGTVSDSSGNTIQLPTETADTGFFGSLPVMPAFELTLGWAF